MFAEDPWPYYVHAIEEATDWLSVNELGSNLPVFKERGEYLEVTASTLSGIGDVLFVKLKAECDGAVHSYFERMIPQRTT